MGEPLRKTVSDATQAVNQANMLFRSKQKMTVFVEGLKDVRFYNQYNEKGVSIEFLDGKDNVLAANRFLKDNDKIENKDFAHFVVDVDRDFLLNKVLSSDNNLNYHVWDTTCTCPYNDLETYLVCTDSFVKFLVNYDVERAVIPGLLSNLLESASYIGAFRLADDQLMKECGSKQTILDSLKILDDWFDSSMCLNKNKFDNYIETRLKHHSKYALLIDKADENFKNKQNNHSLCRGHDLTEIIAIYLKKGIDYSNAVELGLRLAAEKSLLDQSEFHHFSFWNLL